MTKTAQIKPLEERVISLVVTGRYTSDKIAEQIGTSVWNVRRIRKLPHCREAVAERSAAWGQRFLARIEDAGLEALEVLSEISGKADPGSDQIRVASAGKIFDAACRVLAKGMERRDESDGDEAARAFVDSLEAIEAQQGEETPADWGETSPDGSEAEPDGCRRS